MVKHLTFCFPIVIWYLIKYHIFTKTKRITTINTSKLNMYSIFSCQADKTHFVLIKTFLCCSYNISFFFNSSNNFIVGMSRTYLQCNFIFEKKKKNIYPIFGSIFVQINIDFVIFYAYLRLSTDTLWLCYRYFYLDKKKSNLITTLSTVCRNNKNTLQKRT